MDQHELASDAWLEVLRGLVAEGLAGVDLTGVEFCLSEEYHDPPAHLRRPGLDTIGWHLRISDGTWMVADVPDDAADLRVVADYESLIPLAVEILPDGGPGAETQARVDALIASGRLAMHGDRRRMPAAVTGLDLHNRLAPYTAPPAGGDR
jgi:hypothetical protein